MGNSYSRLPLYLLVMMYGIAPLLGQAQAPPKPVVAQCVTDPLPAQKRQTLERDAAQAITLKRNSAAAFAALTYIPIRPHIIRMSNGTGGYTLTSLNNVMALVNQYYLQSGNGIQFYFAGTTPDYIDDDALYTQFRKNTDEATIAPRDATNALNQYYIHAFDQAGLGGYAFFPENTVQSTRTFILDENNDGDMGNRLIPHELGHTFNLLHTHDPYYGYELVTRGAGANCTMAGDLVCDTPADPYGRYDGANSSCVSTTNCPPVYNCQFTDEQGNVYTPSPTNLMSYYFPCTHDFTAGQYDRMQAALALRQTHTTYTLNAPPTAMTGPSGLTAIVASTGIALTWQDNSSTETGFFIERSTMPASGFMPVGGVAPNVTTFTDTKFASRTTYYYRIRPSNTTTGSLSNPATVTTPDCRPTFAGGCQFDTGLNGFTLNNVMLSVNSGCSPTAYTSFTATTATVAPGQSYTFTATLQNPAANPDGLTIWADGNRNGTFEPGERIFQTPTTLIGTVSGTLTIPASTTNGTLSLRLVAVYNTVPNDPCGSYAYGETEDYVLTVGTCASMTTLKAGAWNDPTVWSCNRVPLSTDVVTIGHVVTLSAGYGGVAKQVRYTVGGRISWGIGCRLMIP